MATEGQLEDARRDAELEGGKHLQPPPARGTSSAVARAIASAAAVAEQEASRFPPPADEAATGILSRRNSSKTLKMRLTSSRLGASSPSHQSGTSPLRVERGCQQSRAASNQPIAGLSMDWDGAEAGLG